MFRIYLIYLFINLSIQIKEESEVLSCLNLPSICSILPFTSFLLITKNDSSKVKHSCQTGNNITLPDTRKIPGSFCPVSDQTTPKEIFDEKN